MWRTSPTSKDFASDFLKIFGFGFAGVDYDEDLDPGSHGTVGALAQPCPRARLGAADRIGQLLRMPRKVVLRQRIQQFRLGAYAWLAVLLAILAVHADPAAVVHAALIAPALVPAALWIARRALREIAQDVENFVTPALVGLLGLPMLPTAAAFGALLTGTMAQFGWRRLPRGAALVAMGWCAGTLFAPGVRYEPSVVADGLCLAFMLLYTTPLCALGYEETMRMHRMREHLRAVSGELAKQRDKLSRYVAAPVVARLAAQPSVTRPLERRWLTVAFVDITDFTALTERLEPEDLDEPAGRVLRRVVGAVVPLRRQCAQIPGRRRADQLW